MHNVDMSTVLWPAGYNYLQRMEFIDITRFYESGVRGLEIWIKLFWFNVQNYICLHQGCTYKMTISMDNKECEWCNTAGIYNINHITKSLIFVLGLYGFWFNLGLTQTPYIHLRFFLNISY